MIEKLCSGGQTGVDMIGLRAGQALGLKTGGTAPKGWRTEKGPKPILAEYGLVESPSEDYAVRTEDNVRNSDATIIFGRNDTPGFKCTLKAIKKHSKPYIYNPNSEQFLVWLKNHPEIRTLNVAGNRGSKLTTQQRIEYGTILYDTIKLFNSLCTTS